MVKESIITFLWSISPFGEAKVGIPYGLAQPELNKYYVFVLCLVANILVFPLMMFFLEKVNKYLLRWRFYRNIAIKLALRAKYGSKEKIKKYGYFGLIFFVGLPLPGTGVYVGTIATYILGLDRQKAFWANAVGILFSCLFVWTGIILGKEFISSYF
ncbi:MAG: putative membrane protein [Saprospiraceae bacterium]|jgi:uncharacterized membrane protein|uniref:COG2426 family protein n=1 Tax=Patiriisocius sp. Uisw_047 TaxID=3230969 RepID=UPI0039ECDAD0